METFKKFDLFQKLKQSEVLEAIKDGATLTKVYGNRSYWVLTYIDGIKHYNFRKDATNIRSKNNIETFVTEEGIAYKYKN